MEPTNESGSICRFRSLPSTLVVRHTNADLDPHIHNDHAFLDIVVGGWAGIASKGSGEYALVLSFFLDRIGYEADHFAAYTRAPLEGFQLRPLGKCYGRFIWTPELVLYSHTAIISTTLLSEYNPLLFTDKRRYGILRKTKPNHALAFTHL